MRQNSRLIIPKLLLLLMFSAVLVPDTRAQDMRKLKIVVIDAGHGGIDPGAVSGGVQEKDIVLDLALRLGTKIKNAYPDVKVIYTRSKDIFIPLYQRADIANRNKADVFISLHANYVKSPSASGTETFTMGLHRSQENLEVAKKENSVILLEEDYTANYEGFNPNETESYIMFENIVAEYQTQSIGLAANIQHHFTDKMKLINRGVKQAGFLVLRQTTMPSVLVEVGFISNPEERRYLTSENGKNKVVESIFEAFTDYKRNIEDRSRFNMISSVDTSENVADTTSDDQTANKTNKNNESAKNSSVQKPVKNESTANSGISKTPNETKSVTYYAVQIATSQKLIDTKPTNFKGEKNVKRVKVKNVYKFFAGSFQTFDEANKERIRLRKKYADAFVVLVENGIPVVAKNPKQ